MDCAFLPFFAYISTLSQLIRVHGLSCAYMVRNSPFHTGAFTVVPTKSSTRDCAPNSLRDPHHPCHLHSPNLTPGLYIFDSLEAAVNFQYISVVPTIQRPDLSKFSIYRAKYQLNQPRHAVRALRWDSPPRSKAALT